MAGTQPCPLAYPQKFQAAVIYVNKLMNENDLPEEAKLLLYALDQQATKGPCNEPRPWGWNVVNNAKWQSWKQLGDLAGTEAMRLYVRTLEEELPNWWSPKVGEALENEEKNAESNGTSATTSEPSATTEPSLNHSRSSLNTVPAVKSRSVAEVVVEGSWVSPYISTDRRPPPRYEQAMALVGNSLYVIGGNCGGRYLADTWALNLENLTWTCVAGRKTKQAAVSAAGNGVGEENASLLAAQTLPPVAGHIAVAWNGNVVAIGGHTKAKEALEMPVRLLDCQAGVWSELGTTLGEGILEAPRARGGHTATVIGTKVYIFGGETAKRQLSDELWTLDLTTLEWNQPETSGPAPTARSAHTACTFRNRYIIIFGGGSVANCFSDLAVLDTQTMQWTRPEAEGPVPPPRAGHAAAILGSTLYIVGGGNNARGCADMYALDLAPLGSGVLQWTLVGNTPAESAIASEGLSLLCIPMAGCMVSFGGYNGRYHNAVHVYRPEGFVVLKPGPAAAQGAQATGPNATAAAQSPGIGQKTQSAQDIASEKSSTISAVASGAGAARSHQAHTSSDVDGGRRDAAAAKEAVALELSIMRRQLDSATAALADAERIAEEAREALAAEQQRAVALEVEVAELRQKLISMIDLEKELARYRHRAAEEAVKKPGLWGFITGADQAAASGDGDGK